MPAKIGLVLPGGGARAAYQAGVLSGIAKILPLGGGSPFRIVTGVSSGAINGACLAAAAPDFREATGDLCRLWATIEAKQVFRTDVPSLASLGMRWIRDLSLGGLFGGSRSTHLLDTSPLRELLSARIDFPALSEHLRSGVLHGLAVSATSYATGMAVTFFDGSDEIRPWVRSSRRAKREPLTLDHVLASASIPILFPPVRIGGSYYGDGGVRLRTPMSPAIHLGADRIVAVGVRSGEPERIAAQFQGPARTSPISAADIAGMLLNAAFLDTLDSDIETLERINELVSVCARSRRAETLHGFRQIPLLVIRPSRDLGAIASDQFRRFPLALQYLLRGTGASQEKGWDFLSYLAFDPHYAERLIALGLEDAWSRREEIASFFASDEPPRAPATSHP